MPFRIIPRNEWGARPRRDTPVSCPNKLGIIIHHTYIPGNGVFKTTENIQLQRGMQNAHMSDPRCKDIYQAFTVFQNGDVMEGREGGIFTNNGAAKQWCCPYVGIECQGNFEVMPPTSPQLKSLMDLLVHICQQGVPPVLKGHYEMPYNNTACPGQHMKNMLPQLEQELRQRLSSEEGDDMGKLIIPPYGNGEFRSPEGFLVYNIPSCHKDWWFDITNEHENAVLLKLYANAFDKTDSWGLWYTELHIDTMDTKPGVHQQLKAMPWLAGGHNILPEFTAVSIHAEKPIMIMVGA